MRNPRPVSTLLRTPAEWPAETAELVAWFLRFESELPREPFDLWPWARVVDPAVFHGKLRRSIAGGPRHEFARCGSLHDHLARLRELFWSAVPAAKAVERLAGPVVREQDRIAESATAGDLEQSEDLDGPVPKRLRLRGPDGELPGLRLQANEPRLVLAGEQHAELGAFVDRNRSHAQTLRWSGERADA